MKGDTAVHLERRAQITAIEHAAFLPGSARTDQGADRVIGLVRLNHLTQHNALHRVANLHAREVVITGAGSHPLAKSRVQRQHMVFCPKMPCGQCRIRHFYHGKISFRHLTLWVPGQHNRAAHGTATSMMPSTTRTS